MKRKLWCLMAIFWLSAVSVLAQNEYTVGYCGSELPDDMRPVSLSESEVRMSAAIYLPATKMMRYKGCNLTKIRFAVVEGFENVTVWVRTSLTSNSKVIQSVPEVVNGWNEVTLNQPFPIDGGDLYIGYSAFEPANFWGILAYGEGNEYTSWLAVNNDWNDYHDHGLGILFIEGVVEGMAYDNDLAVMNLDIDRNLLTPEETVQVSGTVVNAGTMNIAGCQVSVSIDDGEAETLALNASLTPEGTATFTHELSLASLEEGRHEVVVRAECGDIDDENAENDVARVPIYIYTSSYPRTILLEHFTSLACVNCPREDKKLEEVVGERSDVAWVSHHVGYHDDEFTLEASRSMTRFGVDGNPFIIVDRTILEGNDNPAFTTSALTGEELGQYVFDFEAAQPAFIQLQASADAVQNVVTIDVEGEAKSFVSELFPRAMLNLYLEEDNVKASRPQLGDNTKIYHDNITRAILTPTRGVLPTWTDETHFTYSTTFDLPSEWNQHKMRLVAFVVEQAEAGTNYPTGKVLNTTQVKMQTDVPTDIEAIDLATDASSASQWFTIDGVRLSGKPTSKGIYIAKGKQNKKLLIP